jgi:hypothetical protein
MPEAPPFPFNSAGTLYMCPPTLTSVSRTNRLSSFQQSNRRIENENNNINHHQNIDTTINSSSTLSKDSNDTSIIDSIDDNQSCSITDAPLTLVKQDDERERSTSTESLTSSKYDEQQQQQQLTNEEENNSVLNVN